MCITMSRIVSGVVIMKKYLLIILVLLIPSYGYSYSGWSYISNGSIKIGINLDWGGVVAYFSRVSPERNLINYYDAGRYIQQSYYGNAEPGVYWNGMQSWWNPVQGGDQYNNHGQVIDFTNDGTTMYAKTIPLDWAQYNVPIEGYMEEWITLSGDTAKIHYKFTYTGSTAQIAQNDEVPAMYFDYALKNLNYYGGSSPWTNGTLTSIIPPDSCTSFYSTEHWVAYVDDTGWGIGAYTPLADNEVIYDFVACIFSCSTCPTGYDSYDTSYVSRQYIYAFTQGSSFEYDLYLTIGTLSDIRSRFYIPLLFDPAVAPLNPKFMWKSVSNANSYDAQICNDSACSSIVLTRSSIINRWHIVYGLLNPNTTYWFQVRSVNSCGDGSWSSCDAIHHILLRILSFA